MNTVRQVVPLASLIELPNNPNVMSESEYALLKENVLADGGTQTQPILGWLVHDDETRQPTAGIMVLSGNHRRKACMDVGFDMQEIIIITDYLTPEQRAHIALRHNNLHGDIDMEKTIAAYELISSPKLKSMTGLTDKKLGLLKNTKLLGSKPPGLLYNVIAIVFTPSQLQEALAAFELAGERVKTRTKLLAAYKDYDAVMDGLEMVRRKTGVTNIAAQLAYIMEVFVRHVDDEP